MNFILMVPVEPHNCHSSQAPHWDNESLCWAVQIGCGDGCAFKNISTSWVILVCTDMQMSYIAQSATTNCWNWRWCNGTSQAWGGFLAWLFVSFCCERVCVPRTKAWFENVIFQVAMLRGVNKHLQGWVGTWTLCTSGCMKGSQQYLKLKLLYDLAILFLGAIVKDIVAMKKYQD